MEIKVLGTGCAKCKQLEKTVREAVAELGLDAERHAVLDAMIVRQAEPPMVVVNGVVACFGDVDLDAVVRVAREVTGDGGCGC